MKTQTPLPSVISNIKGLTLSTDYTDISKKQPGLIENFARGTERYLGVLDAKRIASGEKTILTYDLGEVEKGTSPRTNIKDIPQQAFVIYLN